MNWQSDSRLQPKLWDLGSIPKNWDWTCFISIPMPHRHTQKWGSLRSYYGIMHDRSNINERKQWEENSKQPVKELRVLSSHVTRWNIRSNYRQSSQEALWLTPAAHQVVRPQQMATEANDKFEGSSIWKTPNLRNWVRIIFWNSSM